MLMVKKKKEIKKMIIIIIKNRNYHFGSGPDVGMKVT